MPEQQMIVAGVDVGGTTIKARAVRVDSPFAPEGGAAGSAAGGWRPDGWAAGGWAAGGWTAGVDAPGVRATPLAPAIRRSTPAHEPETALEQIAATVRTLAEQVAPEPLRAVGVVVPGIIDEPDGVAVFQAQLGWDRMPVAARLGELTGSPVALGHDVRGGGLAEWCLGAGRGCDDVLFVMLGTGVGSAAIVDGRLLTAEGYAGQLGHIQVRGDLDTPAVPAVRCGCGQDGCLGMLASASAVVRRYRERAGRDDVTEAEEVAARARAGDVAAVAVWDDAVNALAAGLADAITLFGTERIVLGGGLALAGEQLTAPVAERLAGRLTFHRRPTVVPAELGDESSILGAALLAERALDR